MKHSRAPRLIEVERRAKPSNAHAILCVESPYDIPETRLMVTDEEVSDAVTYLRRLGDTVFLRPVPLPTWVVNYHWFLSDLELVARADHLKKRQAVLHKAS